MGEGRSSKAKVHVLEINNYTGSTQGPKKFNYTNRYATTFSISPSCSIAAQNNGYHPCKVDQAGPAGTFTLNPTQLPTDHIWKDLIYSHYSLHTSTPILGVRAELGAFPNYIQGICQLHGIPLPPRMSPPGSQSSQSTESNSYTIKIHLVEQHMASPQPLPDHRRKHLPICLVTERGPTK